MRTFKVIPLILVLSLSIFLISCSENNPSNPSDNFQTFQKTFDNGFDDVGMDVLQTENGDYIIAGYAKSQEDPGANSYIIRLNKNGETIWSNVYTEDEEQYCTGIVKTDDGFVFGGSKGYWFNGEGHFFLTKIDHDGEKIWHHAYGDNLLALSGAEFIQVNDGSFIIAGEYGTSVEGSEGFLFIRVDADGNETDRTTFDIGMSNSFDFCASPDGNLVLIYRLWNHDEMEIQKINFAGESIWHRQRGLESSIFYGRDIIPIDNGYFITGEIQSQESHLFFYQINEDGDPQMFRFLVQDLYQSGNDLKETSDGNLILTGRTSSSELLLMKFKTSGHILWSKQYTYQERSWGASVIETNDGGFASIGVTFGTGLNVADMFFVKTDPNGNVY